MHDYIFNMDKQEGQTNNRSLQIQVSQLFVLYSHCISNVQDNMYILHVTIIVNTCLVVVYVCALPKTGN